MFDEACRYIMDRLLKFAKDAMENRKSNTNDSFEYSCFHFYASDELATICSNLLPTEPMRTIKSGWPILARVLADILRGWLVDAVRIERRKKNPDLYRRRLFGNLTREELKSETHRVMSWAIKSARDIEKHEESAEYKILDMMICQEKDVDDEYIARRYDMTMLLRNIAGNGGLQLVIEPYFDWGMKVMNIVANQLSEDDINIKGKKSLAHAKKSNSQSLVIEVRFCIDLQSARNTWSRDELSTV